MQLIKTQRSPTPHAKDKPMATDRKMVLNCFFTVAESTRKMSAVVHASENAKDSGRHASSFLLSSLWLF